MLLNAQIVSELIPAGELFNSSQGCSAFTEGSLMGGLDPKGFLSAHSAWLAQIH